MMKKIVIETTDLNETMTVITTYFNVNPEITEHVMNDECSIMIDGLTSEKSYVIVIAPLSVVSDLSVLLNVDTDAIIDAG